MAVDVIEGLDVLDTEDYAAFSKSRDAEPSEPEDEEAPAAGEEETPQSEPADADEADADQTAEESGTEEEEQQEEEEEPQGKKAKDNGLARRMRELTGKIKTLESELAKRDTPAEDAEEAEEEVVSSPESTDKAEKLVRPMLKDFDDTDEGSAWDKYEAAMDAYHGAMLEQQLAVALARQEAALELKHAKAAGEAAWNKASERFPDYQTVLDGAKDVQMNAAMESVMRLDPEAGTELCYYLASHPEESLRIAKVTLANNAQEWPGALARAGMELGKLRATIAPPGKASAAANKIDGATKTGATKIPTAAPPTTKKVTSASKPPTTIRGGVAAPKTDIYSDEDAGDYNKWNRQREKELALDKRK